MKRQRSIHSWRSFQAFSLHTWERLNSQLRARDRVKKRDIQKRAVTSVIINLKNTVKFLIKTKSPGLRRFFFLWYRWNRWDFRVDWLLLFRRFPAGKESPCKNKNYRADTNISRSWYQAQGTKLHTWELKRFQEVRTLLLWYTSF